MPAGRLPSSLPGALANFGVENLLDQASPVGMLGDQARRAVVAIWSFPTNTCATRPECEDRLPVCRRFASRSLGISVATDRLPVGTGECRIAAPVARVALPRCSWNKWWFDELYDYLFVRPTLAISRFVAIVLDRGLIDGFINSLAYIYRGAAAFVSVVGDRWLIDNIVDTFAAKTWDLALSMRSIQTGRLRQYVMFIVVGTVVLFVVASLWWSCG